MVAFFLEDTVYIYIYIYIYPPYRRISRTEEKQNERHLLKSYTDQQNSNVTTKLPPVYVCPLSSFSEFNELETLHDSNNHEQQKHLPEIAVESVLHGHATYWCLPPHMTITIRVFGVLFTMHVSTSSGGLRIGKLCG
jgi:hypothetical protein